MIVSYVIKYIYIYYYYDYGLLLVDYIILMCPIYYYICIVIMYCFILYNIIVSYIF